MPKSSRKLCIYLAFFCVLSFLGFMLEFAYPAGSSTEVSFGSLHVSSITVTNPSEVTWNPRLSLKQEEKMFLNKSVQTVHVSSVKSTPSSRKEPLLRIPLSLEQTGVVFQGCLYWRGTIVCTRGLGLQGRHPAPDSL